MGKIAELLVDKVSRISCEKCAYVASDKCFKCCLYGNKTIVFV